MVSYFYNSYLARTFEEAVLLLAGYCSGSDLHTIISTANDVPNISNLSVVQSYGVSQCHFSVTWTLNPKSVKVLLNRLLGLCVASWFTVHLVVCGGFFCSWTEQVEYFQHFSETHIFQSEFNIKYHRNLGANFDSSWSWRWCTVSQFRLLPILYLSDVPGQKLQTAKTWVFCLKNSLITLHHWLLVIITLWYM